MKENLNRKRRFTPEKGSIWNIKVRLFYPALIFTQTLPSELINWKIKVVLN
jgi:hypothetical protein